jgi:hypothetical protein
VFQDIAEYYSLSANAVYYCNSAKVVEDLRFLHERGKLGAKARWVTEETVQLVLEAGDWPTIPALTGTMVSSQRFFMNKSLASFYSTLLELAEDPAHKGQTATVNTRNIAKAMPVEYARSVSSLVKALENPDRKARAEAVRSLEAVAPEELLRHIETVLNDKEGWVRLAGLQFLEELKDADIVAELVERDTAAKDRLACLLGRMGDPRGIEWLLKILDGDKTAKHSSSDVEAAVNLLTQYQDPRVIPALVAVLQRERGKASEVAGQALLDLKAQVESKERTAIEAVIADREKEKKRKRYDLYKTEIKPEPPFTFETYKAFVDEVRVLRRKHSGATGTRQFAMVQELTRKILIELPLIYRTRLPVYLLARCPICGGQVREPIDTFSLSGAGWWLSEPRGFGWFGRCLQIAHETLYPLASKRFTEPSYEAECAHVQAVHYGVNLNGIIPDDVKQARYVIIGSERPGMLRPFIEQEGSYAVVHALPVGRLDDVEWQPHYTAYFVTYFSQDGGAFQRSLLPQKWYDKEFLWPYELMDYDLARWVEAGKLSWLGKKEERFHLRQGSVEEFPYGDVVGLVGRWALNAKRGAQLMPPVQGVRLYTSQRSRGTLETEEKKALRERGFKQ